jgi:hypothetical protein
MLSFMNEDNVEETVNDQAEGSVDGGEEIDAVSGEDYIKPAQTSQNLKRSTSILMAVFAIGGLCLWVMVKQVGPAEASAALTPEELQVESAIASLTNATDSFQGKMGAVIDRFYEFSDVEQVEVDQLQKNPFAHDFSSGSQIELSSGSAFTASLDSALKDDLKKRAGQLQLWTVMESAENGCAMINDKLLYVGDSISGFEVLRIGKGHVVLSADEMEVVLRISE